MELSAQLTTYLLLRAAGAAQIAAVEADDVRARAAEEVDRLQTELDRVKQWVAARNTELTACIRKLERTIRGGTRLRIRQCVQAYAVVELTPPAGGCALRLSGCPDAGKLAAREHAECVGFQQLVR